MHLVFFKRGVIMEKQSELFDTSSVGDTGFCRSAEMVWLVPPVMPCAFEFFCIERPHFYVVNGVPMAFAGEVQQ